MNLTHTSGQSGAQRRRKAAGLTLVEVMISSAVMIVGFTGIIASLLMCRRLSESSIRQGTTLTVIQGYIEQLKNMDYNSVAVSPPSGSSSVVTVPTLFETVAESLTLSSGTPPSTLPPIGTRPAGAADNLRTLNINSTNANAADDVPLNIWIWVQDLSGTVADARDVKAITILYTYDVKDGGRSYQMRDSICTIRSVVPSF